VVLLADLSEQETEVECSQGNVSGRVAGESSSRSKWCLGRQIGP
jgi:hypothetical protein